MELQNIWGIFQVKSGLQGKSLRGAHLEGMRKIKDAIKTVCSLNQHVLPHQTMSYASEC